MHVPYTAQVHMHRDNDSAKTQDRHPITAASCLFWSEIFSWYFLWIHLFDLSMPYFFHFSTTLHYTFVYLIPCLIKSITVFHGTINWTTKSSKPSKIEEAISFTKQINSCLKHQSCLRTMSITEEIIFCLRTIKVASGPSQVASGPSSCLQTMYGK